MRDWLRTQIPQDRQKGSQWTDLWSAVTSIDYFVAEAKTEQEVTIALATSDHLEILLRRLASYVYECRSGDHIGASHMLAVRAPGS